MIINDVCLSDMCVISCLIVCLYVCINSLAHIFFQKLSERSNNPIYNLLGDIIGLLSLPSPADAHNEPAGAAGSDASHNSYNNNNNNNNKRYLNRKEFEITMNFLLSFVKKDK